MSNTENTATVTATPVTEKGKRGRKVGSTNIPASAMHAFLMRTREYLKALPEDAQIAVVADMSKSPAIRQEFNDSPEAKNVRRFKVIEAISGWSADIREDYIRAIVETADPRERKLIAELIK